MGNAAGMLRQLVKRVVWTTRLRPTRRTMRAIESQKESQRLADQEYSEHPKITVIVQSFNQARNIERLESSLRNARPDELIVCEDGSIDGSLDLWLEKLRGPNDFLLRSNDIHEIRSYGRAIGYARGSIVCLMQDDDQPAPDGRWLREATDLFDRYPKLAVLGGWCGFDDFFETEYNAPWLASGDGVIPYADMRSGVPMVFVENVNIGPYFIRKSVYEELGGFDHRFSPPGEPGITFEAEFCYRVWLHGYQVALTDIPVKLETGSEGYIFPGGTSLWGLKEREKNESLNKKLIDELYRDHLPGIRTAIDHANGSLLDVNLARSLDVREQ